MYGRRKFLQVFGFGVASAPLAAKELADQKIGRLAGMSDHLTPPDRMDDGEPMIAGNSDPMSYSERQDRVADWILSGRKIPDEILEEARLRSQWVTALDPDLASKKSWSMSVRIAEQRQRNLADYINQWKRGSSKRRYEKLAKLTGFRWPW